VILLDAGSQWWSTLAAGGANGGARQRRVEEGRRGSNLIEIGSYGGGTVRGTHLGGTTGIVRQQLGLTATTCFLAR
jgi:hypothetical protein